MYWTDSGKPNGTPRIARAHLDGSDMEVFVNTSSSSVPTALTVDYDTNVLYWCDQFLNQIERVDIASRNQTVIVQKSADDCMGLTVFGDYIYWTDV